MDADTHADSTVVTRRPIREDAVRAAPQQVLEPSGFWHSYVEKRPSCRLSKWR